MKKKTITFLLVGGILGLLIGGLIGYAIGYEKATYQTLNWGIETAKNYIKINGIQLQNWK